MKKVMKALFVTMILAFAAVLSGCSAKVDVNLADYVSMDYEGYDGKGTCIPKIDHKKLLADHEEIQDDEYTNAYLLLKKVEVTVDKSTNLSNGDTISVSFDQIDDEAFKKDCGINLSHESFEVTVSGLQTLEKINLFKDIDIRTDGFDKSGSAWIYSYGLPNEFYFVEFDLEKNSNLSNGEKVKIKASDYSGGDLEARLADLGYMAEATEYEYTVTGLKELQEYDCFEGIYVEYKGINGEGTGEVRIDWNVPNEYSWLITYTLDKTENLSNGDIVTVTASFTDSWTGEEIFEAMETRGFTLVSDKKEFTVEGLAEPLTDTAMLDNVLFDLLKMEDIAKINAYFNKGEERSVEPGSLKSVEYIGSIITYQKATSWTEDHNAMFNLYRCDVNCSFDEPRWVYWYSLYDGITKDEEGNFKIPEPTCPSDDYTVSAYMVSGEAFTTEDRTHFYLGYESLDSFKSRHVRNEDIVVFDNVDYEEKDHIIPAFAVVDIIDKNDVSFYTAPNFSDLKTVCVYENGTYTITLNAKDFENGSEGCDGLKYFDIRLINYLNDLKGINDIWEAEISDISIVCDGNPVEVNNDNIRSGIAEDDYIVWLYDDDQDIKGKTAVVKSKDFGFKETAEITFTVSGIKSRDGEETASTDQNQNNNDLNNDDIESHVDDSALAENGQYSVILVTAGEDRTRMIKLVNDYSHIGLMAARDLVDNVANEPMIVIETNDLEYANTVKADFESYGAVVEIKEN